jgi:hypothetical protein
MSRLKTNGAAKELGVAETDTNIGPPNNTHRTTRRSAMWLVNGIVVTYRTLCVDEWLWLLG